MQRRSFIRQQELSHYHAAAIWQIGLEKPDGQKRWLQRAEGLRQKDCQPEADRRTNEITMTAALPVIPEDADNSLPAVIDFREVYAALLSKWLDSDAQAVLGKKYPLMGWV